MSLDAVVIGAGMAGVTAARELTRAGLSVAVVEGGQRVGGRIRSVRDFCEGAVEGGAEFIHGTRALTWPEVRRCGLAVRPCPLVRHTMLNLGGSTRWLPWALLHPQIWPSLRIFHAIQRLSEGPDLSALEFVEARGFRGRARAVAEMTLASHLPGTLDEIGMHGLLDDGVLALESGLNHRVVDGYDRLPAAIARGLDLRFGFVVNSVAWGGDGVTVVSEDGEAITGRCAICTLPVGVLQSGTVRFLPPLPAAKRAALAALRMGPVTKVLLRFDEPFWPSWLALLGCATGPVTLYWPVFYRAGLESPPVLVAYCTGRRAALLSRVGAEEAVEIVLTDLARHFPGLDPHRRLRAARRIDWQADPLARGGYTLLQPGGAGARARLAAPDTGSLFWAGSATASRPIAASVEAAYASGLRAAAEVLAWLSRPASPRPALSIAGLPLSSCG